MDAETEAPEHQSEHSGDSASQAPAKPRKTLRLKPRKPAVPDTLADMLDQPSKVDPYHPHIAVKPSQAVIPDQARLLEIISEMVAHARGAQNMSPRRSDKLKSEASSLVCKLGNAASNRGEDK